MEFIPALPPGTRTNIIHRFEITNAHAVKLSPQNKGTWLLDVETIKERGLAVNFDETFDLNTLVPELIDELERCPSCGKYVDEGEIEDDMCEDCFYEVHECRDEDDYDHGRDIENHGTGPGDDESNQIG